MKRFLGIDPGTTIIGYGVVQEDKGVLTALTWGVIRNDGADPSRGRAATAEGIAALIATHRPDAAGVERLFFMNNQRTAMSVAEMRGVILLTLTQQAIPLLEFTPQQVKQTVCGHGRATKRQIQDMVQMVLHIKEPIRPDDAADGLALALCCATAKKLY